MKILLELVRIIIIFTFFGVLGATIIGNTYIRFGIYENYSLSGGIAILLLLFVLYRNKWQFSGWYKGKGREKLSKTVSWTLVLVSFVLIISPLILSSLFN
ncbi:hypothetical protein PB01_10990 [Psychrobacillus glaciei]|uniref:Uncharacterized protein n=1 Tax=Psychrobacillus glaciei TaxID=2283160 RepID=A0A5J6SN26_9BACI|nr:hypothetical protein [Psychrobacillus glaciei]QFF98984.1 hypothetical protein PB01_09135 [Psychrobacillus glaciei]QFF99308.1 hypothetical protein PB01_10990 [Psychrobacillus glaciei]